MEKKRPAMLFYPGDWLKDPAVRAVSPSARGIWMDMLCLMHESPKRGCLILPTGQPITVQQLSRMTGCPVEALQEALDELETAGVFSRTNAGVIYSRRMIRDEKMRRRYSFFGKKGGGSPLLANARSKKRNNHTFKGSLKDTFVEPFNRCYENENENEDINNSSSSILPSSSLLPSSSTDQKKNLHFHFHSSPSGDSPTSVALNFARIVDAYNRICVSMPKASVTETRKRAFRALVRAHPDLAFWEELFRRAEASDFLSGRSGQWTGCNIDFFSRKSKIDRVLEGVYDNREQKSVEQILAERRRRTHGNEC